MNFFFYSLCINKWIDIIKQINFNMNNKFDWQVTTNFHLSEGYGFNFIYSLIYSYMNHIQNINMHMSDN